MKKCKYCAEEIQDEAILCRYCGKKQNTISHKVTDHMDDSFSKMKETGNPFANIWFFIIGWVPVMALIIGGFIFPPLILIGIIYLLLFNKWHKNRYIDNDTN